MTPEMLSIAAAQAADDKKGQGILLLDIRQVSLIADFFLLATARNPQQARSIADGIRERLDQEFGQRPLRVEGERDAHWILLDYGALVAHIFLPETRDYYDLERLWGDAVRTEWETRVH